MSQEIRQSVLTRMLRGPARREIQKMSEAAQLRSMLRQASALAGLSVTPIATALRRLDLDRWSADMMPDMPVIPLRDGTDIKGLCILDLPFVTSLREVQTRGVVGGHVVEPRAMTAADTVFVSGFVTHFLHQLSAFDGHVDLAGLVRDLSVDTRMVPWPKIVGTWTKCDVVHGEITMGIDGSPREGCFGIVLRLPKNVQEEDPRHREREWRSSLSENVLSAQTPLRAILARMQVTLRAAQDLATGDILPLTGVRVTAVRMETRDGVMVAQGRLGQAAGLRAVRIENPVQPELRDAALTLTQAGLPSPSGVNMI